MEVVFVLPDSFEFDNEIAVLMRHTDRIVTCWALDGHISKRTHGTLFITLLDLHISNVFDFENRITIVALNFERLKFFNSTFLTLII